MTRFCVARHRAGAQQPPGTPSSRNAVFEQQHVQRERHPAASNGSPSYITPKDSGRARRRPAAGGHHRCPSWVRARGTASGVHLIVIKGEAMQWDAQSRHH
jgi:hypothetical protein